MNKLHHRAHRGFTILEIATSLAMLGLAGALVAQLAAWAIGQRADQEHREQAILLVQNLAEAAKAQGPKTIEAWANAQTVPEHLAARWPKGSVKVTVKTLDNLPNYKWLTITAQWNAVTNGVTFETAVPEAKP